MARKEAELVLQNVVYINQALAQAFPERSFDSIKSRRRLVGYKQKVQEFLRRRRSLIDRGSPAPPENPEVLDREADRMIAYFARLEPLELEAYNVEHINRLCLCVGRLSKQDLLEELTLYLRSILPNVERQRRGRPAPVAAPMSRRKQRRQEYARTQDLYRKNRSNCLRRILRDVETNVVFPGEQMEAYWRNVMERENDRSPGVEVIDGLPSMDGVWEPIVPLEIKSAMPSLGTAPGPDGVKARALRQIPLVILHRIFNIMLYIGQLPEHLLESRSTMIPKKVVPESPGDFRPITVSSVITRTFHKILANRMLENIPLDVRQKAFREVDGCSEGIFVLDLILRQHRQEHRSAFLASLDMQKAFDSVTHEAICDTLKSYRMPLQLVEYIGRVYSRSWTRIAYNNEASDPTHPRGGVKQGDSLSPIIFNLIIDRMFRQLPTEIGIDIEGGKTNALAYADDLILAASTKRGLQELIDVAALFLDKCGLNVNIGKSMTVAIKNVPHEKKTVIDRRTKFGCMGRQLPSINREDEWKYLGVPFTPEGRATVRPREKLEDMLLKLTKAPLKPQQRLFALRTMVIPSQYHIMALGKIQISTLCKMDKVIRNNIKKWLCLPNDTCNAYFHAEVADGGLGIPSFRWTTPLLRLNRLKNLPAAARRPTPHSFVAKEIRKAKERLRDGLEEMESSHQVQQRWARLLYASVDGKALRESAKVPNQNSWVRDGTRFLSGRDFIQSIKMRINALPVRSRTSRGRIRDRRCNAGCFSSETLNHVLQHCPRTHAGRVSRHNAVAAYIKRALVQKDFRVEEEPHYRLEGQLRKPDLVAKKGQLAIILDAQVVSEQTDLRRAHQRKIEYYRPLCDQVRSSAQVTDVRVTSITLSCRGVWCKESAEELERLKIIQKKDFKTLTSRVIIGGVSILNQFQRTTTRTDQQRRRIAA